jgi:hypothetical protein
MVGGGKAAQRQTLIGSRTVCSEATIVPIGMRGTER